MIGPGRPRMGSTRIESARDPHRAMTRLFRYLRPYKFPMILVLILVLIYTLLGLVGPYLMGVAIDQFIATRNPTGLAHLALWMLAVYSRIFCLY